MRDLDWCAVLAYDPGGTTGWSVLCVKPRDLLNVKKPINSRLFQHIASGQIVGSEHAQIDQLTEIIDMWPEAAVLGESFVQRIRNTNLETDPAYSPVRINAVLKWWLATEDRFLFKQSPDMGKSSWTDPMLVKSKMEPGGGYKNRHARDAMRHGLTFIERARKQKGLRHAAWPKFYNDKGEMAA